VFHLLQLLDGLKNHLSFSDSRVPQTKGSIFDLEACADTSRAAHAVEAPGSLQHARASRKSVGKFVSEVRRRNASDEPSRTIQTA